VTIDRSALTPRVDRDQHDREGARSRSGLREHVVQRSDGPLEQPRQLPGIKTARRFPAAHPDRPRSCQDGMPSQVTDVVGHHRTNPE